MSPLPNMSSKVSSKAPRGDSHWGFKALQALRAAIVFLRAKPHGPKIVGEVGKSFGHCLRTGSKYEYCMVAMFTSKAWSLQ